MNTKLVSVLIFSLLITSLVLPPAFGGLTEKTYSFDKVKQLEEFYREESYGLDEVEAGKYVEITSLPDDFGSLGSVNKKKKLFNLVLLPLVLAENERLEKSRSRLKLAKKRLAGDSELVSVQAVFVRRMLVRYQIYESREKLPDEISEADVKELLGRVNVVSPSLVMAQAANESAWGSSRFCLKANNVFGEWVYNRDKGLKPSGVPDTAPHRIRIFEDLMDSVRSYMHNLNTHYAYEEFRNIRAEQTEGQDSLELVNGLSSYSERGSAYVEDIASMIKYNNYKEFDSFL